MLVAAMAVPACAFTFPEPDWGALLREKQAMVDEVDFDLYTEADNSTAPYYGARLEPHSGSYIGAIPENSKKLFPVSSYLTYIDGMNATDLYYPANSMIKSDNVITMVGWTITDLNNINYDTVRKTLNTLAGYNKPMFIRFANEMNVSSLGDDPTLYVDTFRRVADMVHEYPQFAMVWSPTDVGALDRPLKYFWPGDEYVDWVGISNYMIEYFQGNRNTSATDSVYFMTGDYSWATNRIKPLMKFMQENNINKPVMISEGGVPTGNKYGENTESWAAPRLRNMLYYLTMKYPQIKMINYFDVHRSDEPEYYDISDHQYAVDIFNQAKNNGQYIPEYGKDPQFTFQKVGNAGTVQAKDGYVPLYTLAYVPHQQNMTINYYVDDNWYSSSSDIPYKTYMKISDLSDGWHKVRMQTTNLRKEYRFFKSGNSVSFTDPAGSGSDIPIFVNGKMLRTDTAPFFQNNRTLVPFRAIFEAIGADVEWNASNPSHVAASKDSTNISLNIGDNIMNVNGRNVTLDVVAQVKNNRTFVPLRAVSEALNCQVDWDGANRAIYITY